MATQQQKERFSLLVHTEAVARLRSDGGLTQRAHDTLQRWHQRRGDAGVEVWTRLLDAGPDAIERAACVESEAAAALRSLSPLGSVLSENERDALRLKCGLAVAPAWAKRIALAVPKDQP